MLVSRTLLSPHASRLDYNEYCGLLSIHVISKLCPLSYYIQFQTYCKNNALVSVKCLFVHFFQTTATLITVRTEMDVLKQLFFKASLRPSAKISSLLDKQSEVCDRLVAYLVFCLRSFQNTSNRFKIDSVILHFV